MRNKELLRLTFATAFAASGEAPGQDMCMNKGRRNFDFVRSLIAEGQASGELKPDFTADELAMGIYGQLNTYVMVRLLVPDCPLDRQTAKKSVELFLAGAQVVPAGVPERGRARSPLRAAGDRSNSARDEQQGGSQRSASPTSAEQQGGSQRSASPTSREQRTMLTQRDK
jgi:hypothetical protein